MILNGFKLVIPQCLDTFGHIEYMHVFLDQRGKTVGTLGSHVTLTWESLR